MKQNRNIQYTADLKYCMLCYLCRVQQATREDTPIVDIDGSCAYKKYRILIRDGKHVAAPSCPSPPLSGWRAVNKDSYQRIGPMIPTVTSGRHVSFKRT